MKLRVALISNTKFNRVQLSVYYHITVLLGYNLQGYKLLQMTTMFLNELKQKARLVHLICTIII